VFIEPDKLFSFDTDKDNQLDDLVALSVGLFRFGKNLRKFRSGKFVISKEQCEEIYP
jgi:hypothetical protein